ncbi:restriction endonuclease [Bryobacterales bacterium F-183]|nr:restriction endonuclease [Bryobacterales bacterium F-183]
MSIPDYQSLMLPVLRAVADREEYTVAAIRANTAAALGLSADELAERLASGTQAVFANRIGWAVQYLKAAGVIRAVRRGVYQVTDRGLDLLATRPPELSVKALRRYPEFLEFLARAAGNPSAGTVAAPVNENKATPEELLESSFKELRLALTRDLLDQVSNGSPAAFEQIVVDLLVAMGYGGSVEDAGKVVGRSGDGGIDGVIKQDKLGLDVIYIQAKRWKDNVGSPEVMKFSGSLTKRHASRGVFITTSSFTKDAMDFVESMPQKIVLIDGLQLASLMIEHNVGVAPAKSYTIKRIDQDYFDNL